MHRIDGFHYDMFGDGKETLVSDEVLKWSNFKSAGYYASEVFEIFTKKKLEKNNINLKDFLLVLAHGRSANNYWKIFGYKEDYEGLFIEDFISYLPLSKNIILYVCNPGGYKLGLEIKHKIVYPKDSTGKDCLEFYLHNL